MMDALYTPTQVANFFLSRAQEEEVGIDPMKLLKLVYIGYGWTAALLDTELFAEPVEAWQHGPVIPSLYHEFKHYRSSPIKELAGELDLEEFDYVEPQIPQDDADVRTVLDRVWQVYKPYSGWALRNKTHEDNTPWSDVYTPNDRHTEIPYEKIQAHFRKKIAEYLEDAA